MASKIHNEISEIVNKKSNKVKKCFDELLKNINFEMNNIKIKRLAGMLFFRTNFYVGKQTVIGIVNIHNGLVVRIQKNRCQVC